MADKKYRIGFVGSYSADKTIYAKNEKEAKKKFAKQHNVGVSNYIVSRRKKRR